MVHHVEMNRVKHPECGQDGVFSPNDSFCKKQQALNTFGNQFCSNQSLLEFTQGNHQVITTDSQRCANGELTGQNVNDLTIRITSRGLPESVARNLLVVFQHEVFVKLQSGMASEVLVQKCHK